MNNSTDAFNIYSMLLNLTDKIEASDVMASSYASQLWYGEIKRKLKHCMLDSISAKLAAIQAKIESRHMENEFADNNGEELYDSSSTSVSDSDEEEDVVESEEEDIVGQLMENIPDIEKDEHKKDEEEDPDNCQKEPSLLQFSDEQIAKLKKEMREIAENFGSELESAESEIQEREVDLERENRKATFHLFANFHFFPP